MFEYCAKKRPGTLVVGIGKGRSPHRTGPKVIELGRLEVKMVHNVPQTASGSQLSKYHHYQLAPAVKCPVSASRPEAVLFNLFKVEFVKKMKQLVKDCVRMSQGLNLLSFKWVMANATITER